MKKSLMLATVAAATIFSFSSPATEAGQCPNGPDYHYLSRNYTECLATSWTCPAGSEQFLVEDCGCGCVETD